MKARIVRIYHEALFTRMSKYQKQAIDQMILSLTEAQEALFDRAAHLCARLTADPEDFVRAQFEAFDVASELIGKFILPRPAHLSGDGAERRWKAARDGKNARRRSEAQALLVARRAVPGTDESFFYPEEQVAQFFRDERKLRNLSNLLRLDTRSVLEKHPREFSKEFLVANGAA